MPWQALTVVANRISHPEIEQALEAAGALAVTTEDAGDVPVLEPGVGEIPLWPHLRITGLFTADVDRHSVSRQVSDLEGIQQGEQLSWQRIADQNWERAWMDRFQPMDFGHGLWVCPSGQPVPTQAGHVLKLDPGLAFGTGTHPTTALCLRWLAENQNLLEDARILDYGCGSGILGIAAAILGAQGVVAVDHDPQALLATRDNAQRNDVATRISTMLPDQEPEPADGFNIVLANILAAPLIELADHLVDHLKPGGWLMLSGILGQQVDQVQQAYAARLNLEATSEGDWVRLVGEYVNHD